MSRVHVSPLHPVNLTVVEEIDFIVATNTVINTHYPAVTFQAVPLPNTNTFPGFGDVRAVLDPALHRIVITPNAPNTLPPFDESGGGILAKFQTPQLYVSIDAQPTISAMDQDEIDPNTRPYLSVFGVAPAVPHLKPPLLATVPFPLANTDANFESWQSIQYLSPSLTPNIGSILFSSARIATGASVYTVFTRLRFSTSLPQQRTIYLG
jgi:hypothetical protein